MIITPLPDTRSCYPVSPATAGERVYDRTSVGLIIVQRGSIILQQRDEGAPTDPLFVATFGGTVDPGEDAVTAAVREIAEELHVQIMPADLVPLGLAELLGTPLMNPNPRPADGTRPLPAPSSQLANLFFWNDTDEQATLSSEGRIVRFATVADILAQPRLRNDAKYGVAEAQRRGLIR